jgi:signal transduction histidine kinase
MPRKIFQKFECKIVLLGAIAAAFLIFALYFRTAGAIENATNQNLLRTAKVAALQFSAENLKEIQKTENVESAIFQKVVAKLEEIRAANSEIASIYILRKTENPEILKFVVDADFEDFDENDDGEISDDEKEVRPGDEYEISDAPKMRDGFSTPVFESEIYEDLWGPTRSAYAPIFDGDAEFAILGIDLSQENFLRKISVTKKFSIGIFFIFLILILVVARLFKKEKNLARDLHASEKLATELKNLDAAKNNFLAVASHHLRTPLSSARWFLEMFLDGDFGKISDEQKDALENIFDATTKMIWLVNNLMHISELEAGKTAVQKTKFNLAKMARGILENCPIAREKNHRTKFSAAKNCGEIFSDEKLVEQVVRNLISNAAKYTPPNGEISVELKSKKDGDAKFIELSVADNGPGIAKKDADKIFEKFHRAENVVYTESDGAGIGLCVCKLIVEKLGGWIGFAPRKGGGTRFWILIEK